MSENIGIIKVQIYNIKNRINVLVKSILPIYIKIEIVKFLIILCCNELRLIICNNFIRIIT